MVQLPGYTDDQQSQLAAATGLCVENKTGKGCAAIFQVNFSAKINFSAKRTLHILYSIAQANITHHCPSHLV
jgi:hypothetical protein